MNNISIDDAWEIILSQASLALMNDWQWLSPVQNCSYSISNIEKNIAIVLNKEDGKKLSRFAGKLVENFLTRLNDNSGKILRTDRKTHGLSVSKLSAIVYLHPLLDWSENDNKKWILIRNTPKDYDIIYGLKPGNNEAERQYYARLIRKGQPYFRKELLRLYNNACCITGTSVEIVLDGAHIQPFHSTLNCEISNGLLLRADIHDLFDNDLIRIKPKTFTIVVDKSLEQSIYWVYNNQKLTTRVDGKNPSKKWLTQKWNDGKLKQSYSL